MVISWWMGLGCLLMRWEIGRGDVGVFFGFVFLRGSWVGEKVFGCGLRVCVVQGLFGGGV